MRLTPLPFQILLFVLQNIFWHISLQGSVNKSLKCVCISSVVVTLKFVELFCFDRTVTYQKLLLTKNICRTFFSFFMFKEKLRHWFVMDHKRAPRACASALCKVGGKFRDLVKTMWNAGTHIFDLFLHSQICLSQWQAWKIKYCTTLVMIMSCRTSSSS